MKEITLIIKIDIAETEDTEAVVRSFIKTAATARKAEFLGLLEPDQETSNALKEIFEDEEKTVVAKARELVNSKTNPQLKAFKAKYGLETENDKNETLKPAIVEFLMNNDQATFE